MQGASKSKNKAAAESHISVHTQRVSPKTIQHCWRDLCPVTLAFWKVTCHCCQAPSVSEVTHGHIPACSPVDARVTGAHTLQAVDGDVGAPLYHSHGIIGSSNLCSTGRKRSNLSSPTEALQWHTLMFGLLCLPYPQGSHCVHILAENLLTVNQ